MRPDQQAGPHRGPSAAGRFIAVVGPSGVGKDSIMAGLVTCHPPLVAVRRTITRPPDPDGEAHDPLTPEEFQLRESGGAFVLSWDAHGLNYGIPASVLPLIEEGRDLLANLSRSVLEDATRRFERVEVLHVTASPRVLARRLARRGRESGGDVAARLARKVAPLPGGLRVHEISNDGALADALEAASRALYPPS